MPRPALLMVCLGCLLPWVADPEEPAFNIERVAGIGGDVVGGDLIGDLFLFGEGTRLNVIDVTDPRKPRLVGAAELEDVIESFVREGPIVYVSTELGHLFTLDLSIPAAPRIVSDLKKVGAGRSLEISGDRLMSWSTERRSSRVSIFDVTNRRSPRRVQSKSGRALDDDPALAEVLARLPRSDLPPALNFDFSTPAGSLLLYPKEFYTSPHVHVFRRGLLYGILGDQFYVVDTENPKNPPMTGPTYPQRATCLEAMGDLAFIGTETGLEVLQIGHGPVPKRFEWIAMSGGVQELFVDEGRVYVRGQAHLHALEFSDSGLKRRSAIPFPAEARLVAISKGKAFWISDAGLEIRDVSRASGPIERTVTELEGHAGALEVSGRTAYVTLGKNLSVIDISSPSAPSLLATVTTPGDAEDIAVTGDRVYIADGNEGLLVYDRGSKPEDLRPRARVDTPGYAQGVAVAGKAVLVADGWNGLAVLDESDPTTTVLRRSLDLHGYARAVDAKGSTAYVAAGEAGLHVVDVSNPRRPRVIGHCPLPPLARDVLLQGNHALVADGWSGLAIVDVSEPAAPKLVALHPTSGHARKVAVSGTRAYVALGQSEPFPGGEDGFEIVDVSDPTAPRAVEVVAAPRSYFSHSARDLRLGDGRLYLLSFNTDRVDNKVLSELTIHDLPKDAESTLVGLYPMVGNARAVAFEGDSICVASLSGRLSVVDKSEPAKPRVVGSVATGGTVHDLLVRDGLAYVANGAAGLRIYDVSKGGAPSLRGVYAPAYTKIHHLGWVDSKTVVYYDDSVAEVLDVSDPSRPRPRAHLSPGGGLGAGLQLHLPNPGVAISDGEIYAFGESAVVITDVRSPKPTTSAHYIQTDLTSWTLAWGRTVHLWAGLGFLESTNVLAILDVSNPAAIRVLEALEDFQGQAVGRIPGVSPLIIFAFEWGGTFEKGKASSSLARGDLKLSGPGGSYTVQGTNGRSWTYSHYDFRGIQIVDLTDPSRPEVKAVFDTGQSIVRDVAVEDRTIYMAAGPAGLLTLRYTADDRKAP